MIEPVLDGRLPAGPPRAALPATDLFADLLGRHPALVALKRRAARVARAVTPVLLIGESGVGKETLARAIHGASPLAGGPFVTVDCGALPREGACRELFGLMERPTDVHGGRYADARDGTLFLDDIAELPSAAQVLLLQVLQHEQRAGMPPSRVRLIVATRRELEAEVAGGRFRDDLYYRLRTPSLRLPPLRERPEDLPLLIEHFVAQLDDSHGLGRKRASPALLEVLGMHAWPGNVRELQAVIASLYVLGEGDELSVADLPEDITPAAQEDPGSGGEASAGSISRMTRAAIETELARHGDNLSAVARRLGISRSTLYRKIRRYGLELPH